MVQGTWSSESVTEGHPDKMCDAVSDAILDAHLAQDPKARVAVETFATGNNLIVGGEITSTAQVDIEAVARNTVRSIGYLHPELGFSAEDCNFQNLIIGQSPEIANSVIKGGNDYDSIGAGDQGMMFGYATNATKSGMPLSMDLARTLTRHLTDVRKNGTVPYLRPDGKAQVVLNCAADGTAEVSVILVSTQHDPGVSQDTLYNDITRHVVEPALQEIYDNTDGRVTPASEGHRTLVNPSGSFVVGGPGSDAGLTGRKIIVDTYGGVARHGGGAFSGKDATKVDRSAAYAARWVAKTIADYLDLRDNGKIVEVEVQISYAIGVARPLSVNVWVNGNHDGTMSQAAAEVFDLRPAAIIDSLDLRHPRYGETARNGHFGIAGYPWENTEESVKALASHLATANTREAETPAYATV